MKISKNCILVDHTTASADLAKHLSKTLFDKKAYFIDAPVSGGQVGAENGVLSIMCGGEKTIFNKAKKIMSAYGKNISLIGEVGSGQLAKMVNQICIAGLVQGLSEGIKFGVNAKLDKKKVLDVIQTVDSQRLAKKINNEAEKINKKQKIFLQINIFLIGIMSRKDSLLYEASDIKLLIPQVI